jgi:hypothetical protein
MEIKYLVALSFSEFQVLYNSGEIRIFRNRPQQVRIDKKGKIDINSMSGFELMDRMPHIDIEDEHSIIVGLIDRLNDSNWMNDIDHEIHPILPDVYYLSIVSFESFHPLTARGGRLLASRLDGHNLNLLPPIFEDEVLDILSKWSTRRALSGGRALSKLLAGGEGYKPDTLLLKGAISSMSKANFGEKIPESSGTLIDHLFCYVRRVPIPSTDLGFLIDLGLILSEQHSGLINNEMLGPLRSFAQKNEKKVDSIVDLIQMPELIEILHNCDKVLGEPLELSSALLFLKWKNVAQNSKSVDIEQLLNDVKLCNCCTPGSHLSKVVWLFGFYWGIDNLTPEYYFRDIGSHRFINKGAGIKHKPLILKEKIAVPKSKKTVVKKVSKPESDAKAETMQKAEAKSIKIPEIDKRGNSKQKLEKKENPITEETVNGQPTKEVARKPEKSDKLAKANVQKIEPEEKENKTSPGSHKTEQTSSGSSRISNDQAKKAVQTSRLEDAEKPKNDSTNRDSGQTELLS